MTDLKPCPFCKDIPDILFTKWGGYELSHSGKVNGKAHGITMLADTQDELVAAWNTRPREDELEKALEAARPFIKIHRDVFGDVMNDDAAELADRIDTLLSARKEGKE